MSIYHIHVHHVLTTFFLINRGTESKKSLEAKGLKSLKLKENPCPLLVSIFSNHLSGHLSGGW